MLGSGVTKNSYDGIHPNGDRKVHQQAVKTGLAMVRVVTGGTIILRALRWRFQPGLRSIRVGPPRRYSCRWIRD